MNSSLASRVIVLAATTVVAAAAGWFARGPAAAAALPPASAAAPSASVATAAPPEPAPLIAVSSDGNVTLRVEQQPLEWVLEQIARQSGWSDVKARARPAVASASGVGTTAFDAPAAETACPLPPPAPVDATRLLQAIEAPGEATRFDALMQARSDAIVVPEATLNALMATDPSDRVRLAAFESLLETRLDPGGLRETLHAALYSPSAAIQREAQRRLDELQEMERIDAQLAHSAPS